MSGVAAALLSACAPKVPPAAMAAIDGDVVEWSGPIRFGMVGGLAYADTSLDGDLRAAGLSFVVLVGDAVPRGTPRAYSALHQRLDTLPAVPLPGPGEARGDRRLTTYGRAWEGLGVRGVDDDPVPWRAFDLCTDGARWRLVVLDADRERLRDRFRDETFWLPKVLGNREAQVIVVANRPVGTVWSDWDPASSAGAAFLHGLVLRHTDATRLTLVAAGGTPSPELALPGGPWGEGWLAVGRATGPAGTLTRATQSLALEPGFDRALSAWFAAAGMDRDALDAAAAYTADRTPVSGWWVVELTGRTLEAALRLQDAQGAWSEAFRVRWTPEEGWRPL